MKALQPHNVSEFCDVTVTPDLFSIKIISNDPYSQQFAVRVAEFAKFCNREHPMFDLKTCRRILRRTRPPRINSSCSRVSN